jgi:hypothetical protein
MLGSKIMRKSNSNKDLRCACVCALCYFWNLDGFALRAHVRTTFTQHRSIVRITFTCDLRALTRCAQMDEPIHMKAPQVIEIPKVSERRTDSFKILQTDFQLRKEFVDGFLVNVFNLQDNHFLFRKISKAFFDPRNSNDLEIYGQLYEELHSAKPNPVSQISSIWKSAKQLREQKHEICRETVSLVTKLGKYGRLRDLVSIGDFGKLVLEFRRNLGMDGNVWIVNDSNSNDIPAVLERGAVDPVGQFVKIDFESVGKLQVIPDNSADLVTMNQVMHCARRSHARVIRTIERCCAKVVRTCARSANPSTFQK